MKCRAKMDGKVGWVTVVGNTGMVPWPPWPVMVADGVSGDDLIYPRNLHTRLKEMGKSYMNNAYWFLL